MRLGVFQTTSPAGNAGEAYQTVAAALTGAAADGVDMLVMPELFIPGYNADPQGRDFDADLARLSDLARGAGIGLTIGLPEATSDGLFNTAVAIGADGRLLSRYRKIQLFGPRETALFTPGAGFGLFDYLGHRLALMICYDVEFPEHVRALARAGAEALLVPTANMMPYTGVNALLVPARAMENGLTIAYANYCGAEAELTYTARSLIAGPLGTVMAQAGSTPALIHADLPSRDAIAPTRATQLADFRGPQKVTLP